MICFGGNFDSSWLQICEITVEAHPEVQFAKSSALLLCSELQVVHALRTACQTANKRYVGFKSHGAGALLPTTTWIRACASWASANSFWGRSAKCPDSGDCVPQQLAHGTLIFSSAGSTLHPVEHARPPSPSVRSTILAVEAPVSFVFLCRGCWLGATLFIPSPVLGGANCQSFAIF